MKKQLRVAPATFESFGLDTPDLLKAHPDIADAIEAQRRPLVKLARGFARGRGVDPRDFMQEALVAVIKAARSFDPQNGTFPDFILMVARRSMRNQQRKWKVRRAERNGVHIDELIEPTPAHRHRDADYAAVACDGSEQEPIARLDLEMVMDAMKNILTRMERDALYMVVLEDQPRKEVARVLEISRPRVTQLVQAAQKKLRRYFGEHDNALLAAYTPLLAA